MRELDPLLRMDFHLIARHRSIFHLIARHRWMYHRGAISGMINIVLNLNILYFHSIEI